MSRATLSKGASSLKINKIAAGTALSVLTAGAAIAATALPAGASAPAVRHAPAVSISGTVKVNPNKNVVQGQSVHVTATNFPASDAGKTMYVFECAVQALSTQNPDYCDTHPADGSNGSMFATEGTSAGGSADYTILTGSHFHPTNKAAKCGFSSKKGSTSSTCYVVVSDTATNTNTTTWLDIRT